MKRDYKVNKHNSTVCGYPGRGFDWSKFDWAAKTIHRSIFKGQKNRQAPEVYVDNGLISPNSEYLHVPYDWVKVGTIYRVRPNESMEAGQVYRGHLILKQTAIKKSDGWYWRLKFSSDMTRRKRRKYRVKITHRVV